MRPETENNQEKAADGEEIGRNAWVPPPKPSMFPGMVFRVWKARVPARRSATNPRERILCRYERCSFGRDSSCAKTANPAEDATRKAACEKKKEVQRVMAIATKDDRRWRKVIVVERIRTEKNTSSPYCLNSPE